MLIKVIDAEKLIVRMADWGHPNSYKHPYEVLAIKESWRILQYLVKDDNRLKWWDADLFEVIDNSIPEDWVEIHYKRFHRYKNRKYNFVIPTRYYNGPKEFIDSEDFLFNTLDEPALAYDFYKQCISQKTNS